MLKILLVILFIGVLISTIAVIFTLVNSLDENNDVVVKKTPTPEKKPENIKIAGWTAYWDNENTIPYLTESINGLSSVSPMLYRTTTAGNIQNLSVNQKDLIKEIAGENNIPVYPIIIDDFTYSRIRPILYNSSVRRNFINETVEIAKEEGYDGWDLDIESLKEDDREEFTVLVRELGAELHKNGLKFTVVVFAKEADVSLHDPATAQDYTEIGKFADEVRIMAYGYHNEGTGKGAQAPISWYRSVLSYAESTIPKDKIVVGLSSHGYDFGGITPEALTYPEAQERIGENNASISYNKTVSSKIATYKVGNREHEIWYEDAETIREKMDIARKDFGFTKFILWRIGAEDKKIWDPVKN